MNEESLFAEALGKQGEARAAFLDEHCQDDVELRQRLDALLRAHDHPDPFLEAPARPPAATVDEFPSGERPGTVIGPYKLIEPIGEGGMGTVWMAQQTAPVKRLVALKLIKAGMDSKQVIARFEAERQALALMDHANIARVLDGGTTGAGRPYFVMDLVKGVPITRYCDEHHLTPRQRLELFIPVCHAVQHAHQKGIIHRDLKPSNVLVALYDGKPVPKVIDFGVAKAAGQSLTDKTLVTGFGNIVGTLEYMSPEQAEVNQLDIDTRSDIYSLGVLLYELLTGSPPFSRKELEKAGMLEMLRVIREQEPSKPSTKLSTAEGLPTLAANRGMEPAKLTKLVRGELDWIVMKALEKDRKRRYETANGFAADVQRYLNDEPVQACPPSAGYRLRKFARRNKSALAIIGVVLFFLVMLGGGAGWVIRDREAQEQEASRQRAARQAKLAADLELALDRAELLEEQGKQVEALRTYERADLVALDVPESAMHSRLKALKLRLDAHEQDKSFIARIDEIRRFEQTEVDAEKNTFNAVKAYPRIREALREYGMEIGATPPEAAVARIRQRPKGVQGHLVAALDECLRLGSASEHSERIWLIEVLKTADADPWRTAVRKAGANGSELQRLARTADVSQQPPSFLLTLAKRLPFGTDRLMLCRRIQRAWPSDFWANHRLACDLREAGWSGEAVRYHTAALALQPNNAGSYLNRALALEDIIELNAAIADLDRALELAPGYPMAAKVKARVVARNSIDAKLTAVLKEQWRPETFLEFYIVANHCDLVRRRHAAAARLYMEILKAFPETTSVPLPLLAGYAAARAGCGEGTDRLGDADQARVRREGLQYLRTFLDVQCQRLNKAQGGNEVRSIIRLLKDPLTRQALAGVRTPAALARFSKEEQNDWQAFWSDLNSLLKEAEKQESRIVEDAKRAKKAKN